MGTIRRMDGSPQLLTDVKFTQLKRGGYDPDQVDNFLERVSAAVSQLQDKLRLATERAESADAQIAEARRLQTEAQAAAEQAQADLAAGGGPRADGDAVGGDDELKKVLVLAQRAADQAVDEANANATQTMADARAKAVNLLAEAEQERDRMLAKARKKADAAAEERAHELHQRVEVLLAARTALEADIDALQTHLDTEGGQLQERLLSVQRLLDDPRGFRLAEAPAVSTVVLPIDDDDGDLDAAVETDADPDLGGTDLGFDPEGAGDTDAHDAGPDAADVDESTDAGSSFDTGSSFDPITPVESPSDEGSSSAPSTGTWSSPTASSPSEPAADPGSVAVMTAEDPTGSVADDADRGDEPPVAALVEPAVVELDVEGIDTGTSTPLAADDGDTIDLTSERLFGQVGDDAGDLDGGPATQLFTPGNPADEHAGPGSDEKPADSPLGEPDEAADAAMRAFFDADMGESSEPPKPRFGRRR